MGLAAMVLKEREGCRRQVPDTEREMEWVGRRWGKEKDQRHREERERAGL